MRSKWSISNLHLHLIPFYESCKKVWILFISGGLTLFAKHCKLQREAGADVIIATYWAGVVAQAMFIGLSNIF